MKFFFQFVFYAFLFQLGFSQNQSNALIKKGWEELIKDNENKAFFYFWEAKEKAEKTNNSFDKAESLLYLGICSYGSNLQNGLQFATQSLETYSKLENTSVIKAKMGRFKCLQLISTIYARQGKYEEALQLSKEVISELENENQKDETLGLAYNSLGFIYEQKNSYSLSEKNFKKALVLFEKNKSYAYVPMCYFKLGEIYRKKKNENQSLDYLNKALKVSIETKNKQALINTQIALGNWYYQFKNDHTNAKNYFTEANKNAASLKDKTFQIKTIEALVDLNFKTEKDYKEIASLQNNIIKIKDQYNNFKQQQTFKNLEIQFEISEKDRKLKIIETEKEKTNLINYFLIVLILLIASIAITIYVFLKRINKRDKQLLVTKEKLFEALQKQEELKRKQFQNDIEHKESQLSAITIQILEKNELLKDIKQIINKKESQNDTEIAKLISKHTFQDKSWQDFDFYFESINKNFYTRLKNQYPEISTNDLKMCALIKLNLSIKEMASILNISPDSVKTARHRLRKKLQLSTEENLTDFILSI
ncbi:conserved hypothetical protein [Flavobacterium sp. 9AF]|uniref:tetratricopeptide repeat protein n=1 Tax=Flavobacterium sp. 9AF TaxID=2653142 RepID=UPI0012F2A20C|nr:tetratricopeptide repeat protein [Flavobacterium sp. 9AF]VXC37262.1 conserved hypothetical protein [Flavobacterium sp. 9AF]